jgi:hypothetical protein
MKYHCQTIHTGHQSLQDKTILRDKGRKNLCEEKWGEEGNRKECKRIKQQKRKGQGREAERKRNE